MILGFFWLVDFSAYLTVQLVFTKSMAEAFCFESSRSFALHGSHSWTFWWRMKHRCGTGPLHIFAESVLFSSKCFSKPKTWLRITWRLLAWIYPWLCIGSIPKNHQLQWGSIMKRFNPCSRGLTDPKWASFLLTLEFPMNFFGPHQLQLSWHL